MKEQGHKETVLIGTVGHKSVLFFLLRCFNTPTGTSVFTTRSSVYDQSRGDTERCRHEQPVHRNPTAASTEAGGSSSFHFWQVCALNETCQKAKGAINYRICQLCPQRWNQTDANTEGYTPTDTSWKQPPHDHSLFSPVNLLNHIINGKKKKYHVKFLLSKPLLSPLSKPESELEINVHKGCLERASTGTAVRRHGHLPVPVNIQPDSGRVSAALGSKRTSAPFRSLFPQKDGT